MEPVKNSFTNTPIQVNNKIGQKTDRNASQKPSQNPNYSKLFCFAGAPFIANAVAQSLVQPLNVVRTIAQGASLTRFSQLTTTVKKFEIKQWSSGMGANLLRSTFTTGVPLIVTNFIDGDKGRALGGAINISANLVLEPIQLNIMFKKLSSPSFSYSEKGLLFRTKRAMPFYILRDGLYSYALLSSPKNSYLNYALPFVVGWLTSAPDQVIKQVIYSKDVDLVEICKSNFNPNKLFLPGPILRALVIGLSVGFAKSISSVLTENTLHDKTSETESLV